MWPRKALYAFVVLTLILSALPAMALPAGRPAEESAAETFPPVVQPEAPPPPDQPMVLRNPFVSAAVRPHSFDGDVRKLPAPQPVSGEPRELPVGILHDPSLTGADRAQLIDELQSAEIIPAAATVPPPIQNWEGQDNIDGVYPPDTVGDVGPNHYIQMVNVDNVRIWNKTGTQLASFKLSSLWPIGDTCRDDGSGDPIVLYDPIANRWLLSQFTFPPSLPYSECIAISKTSNPVAGGWWAYTFNAPDTALGPAFPDYPKLGVWPDAYYMSVNQFPDAGGWGGAGVYAYDRATMLTGAAATFQYFDLGAVDLNFGGLLPSDLDGATLPPAGSPNFFSAFDDEAWGVFPFDVLHVWEYHVDWATPANTTFTGPLELATEPFTAAICSAFRGQCIPQPGTTVQLESLSDRLMHRLAYRNFGDHETLVVSHAVQTTDSAGIRWYEIRKSGAGDWLIYQQDTYAPDSHYRWMPSVAMDRSGNLGIGYSVSSSTLYPSIRYSGRLATDPLNTTPRTEQSIIAGTGSQLGSAARWGDYSAMSIDPVDDCTFWYTQEYIQTTGSAPWQTRVASFKFANCTAGPTGTLIGVVRDGSTNTPLANATVRAARSLTETVDTLTNANGAYLLGLPVGTYTVTGSLYGYTPSTIPGVSIAANVTTTQNITLTPAASYVVSGTVTDSTTGWPLYANVTISAEDLPGASIWTHPVTGYYSATLAEGVVYTFDVGAWVAGYDPASAAVGPLAGNTTQNFALDANLTTCNAPGYVALPSEVYSQTFEANNGGYTITGTTSWAWGAPTSGPGSAHSGVNVWATNLTGNYNNSEDGYITSPNINLSAHAGKAIAVAWWQWLRTESGWDYASVEVNNGGATWTRVYGEVSGSIDLAWALRRITLDPTYAVSNFRVRFRLRSDSSVTYSGWYVDDVSVAAITCYLEVGGLVVGNVYDDNTGAPLAGATVDSSAGSATTMATPDDPAVDDSFYTLFAPGGAQTLTATMSGGYGTVVTTTSVVVSNTVRRNFDLPAGLLSYQLPTYNVTLTLGVSTTRPFTLTNSGGLPVSFELTEISGGYQTSPIGPSGPGAQLRRIEGKFSPGPTADFGNRTSGADAPGSQRPIPRTAPPWTAIADYPRNIMDNAVAELDGKLYSVAGYDGSSILANGYVYDPGTNAWLPIASMTYARQKSTASFINGLLYVVGGWNSLGLPVPQLEVYDPNSDSWTSGASIPTATAAAAGIALDGQFYVIGGCLDGACTKSNGVYRYDPGSDTWETLTPYPVTVAWQSCGAIGGQIYCAGGVGDTGSLNNAYVYDPDADTWTAVANMPATQWGAGYTVSDGKLYISGGIVNALLSNEGFVYDPDTDSWNTIANSNNVLYRGGSACGFYKIGGSSGSFTPTPLGEVYPGLTNCAPPSDVPWLTESPISGTLAAGPTNQPVTLGFDAGMVDQPGTYLAQLKIKEDTPYKVTNVPITLTVTTPATWGKLDGTVTGLGYCDANPTLLQDANVFVESGTGMTWTLTTNVSGTYQVWLDQSNSPLTVTVSAAGHVMGMANGVNVTQQMTTTLDFDLRWRQPCFSPTVSNMAVSVNLGLSATLPLTLTNAGAGTATFALRELDRGFVLTMPAQPEGQARIVNENKDASRPADSSAPVPILTSGGPDGFGYTFRDSNEPDGPTYNWIEIAPPAGGSGTEITSLTGVDDGHFWSIALPFTFNFYGADYTNLAVATNGTLYFQDAYLGLANVAIPGSNSYGVNRFIAHMWDDLRITPGAIYYLVEADRIIIEYYRVSRCCTSVGSATWEIVLFNDGNILFQYQDATFGDAGDYGASATIGIQGDTTTGLQYSYNTAALSALLAICFAYPGNPADCAPDVLWLSESPITGTLSAGNTQVVNVTFNAGAPITRTGAYYATLLASSNDPVNPAYAIPVTMTVTAPDITVSPSALTASLVQGTSSTTRTLTLGNVGNGNLTWSLAENPSRTWLSESPTGGTIAPAGNRSIVVTFTATGLTAGTYTTTLRFTSNDPDENLVNVPVALTVTCTPVSGANFSFSPSAPTVGQTVRFTGTVTAGATPITYQWNWGDGSTTSTGSPINHSFPMTVTARSYTVRLTASNVCSAPIVQKLVTVYPYRIFMPVINKNH